MKAWYASKTLWFNILFGLIAVAGLFGWVDFQPSQDVIDIVGVIVAAINIILRFVTKAPVGLSAK